MIFFVEKTSSVENKKTRIHHYIFYIYEPSPLLHKRSSFMFSPSRVGIALCHLGEKKSNCLRSNDHPSIIKIKQKSQGWRVATKEKTSPNQPVENYVLCSRGG